ncbi:MAG: hypothetical protein AMXMBFR57_13690 [Acidimicrobiia bacterium]
MSETQTQCCDPGHHVLRHGVFEVRNLVTHHRLAHSIHLDGINGRGRLLPGCRTSVREVHKDNNQQGARATETGCS